ncbi:MAG: hypothetical protein LBQ26_02525 [Holosporales bacterium]|jgi:hypothetical protein|nr:hypothetical protein [Holosporales bacterium]
MGEYIQKLSLVLALLLLSLPHAEGMQRLYVTTNTEKEDLEQAITSDARRLSHICLHFANTEEEARQALAADCIKQKLVHGILCVSRKCHDFKTSDRTAFVRNLLDSFFIKAKSHMSKHDPLCSIATSEKQDPKDGKPVILMSLDGIIPLPEGSKSFLFCNKGQIVRIVPETGLQIGYCIAVHLRCYCFLRKDARDAYTAFGIKRTEGTIFCIPNEAILESPTIPPIKQFQMYLHANLPSIDANPVNWYESGYNTLFQFLAQYAGATGSTWPEPIIYAAYRGLRKVQNWERLYVYSKIICMVPDVISMSYRK